MCLTVHYRGPLCGHHWLQIAQPCYPGLGFTNCPRLRADVVNGAAREPSPEIPWPGGGFCPACQFATAFGPGSSSAGHAGGLYVTRPGSYHRQPSIIHGGRGGGGAGGARNSQDLVLYQPQFAQQQGYLYRPCTYDRNQIRMIVDIQERWRWGLGPGRKDPGVECVIM